MIARTSIIGSIFANALLVLGLVIVAGCFQSADSVMRFQPRLAKDNVTLMMLASFLIVILGISAASGDKASHHVTAFLPFLSWAPALLWLFFVGIVLVREEGRRAMHLAEAVSVPA